VVFYPKIITVLPEEPSLLYIVILAGNHKSGYLRALYGRAHIKFLYIEDNKKFKIYREGVFLSRKIKK